ncbi:MAG: DUF3298 domain-containing protein [Bacteroidaceae bacterium]|nr:DUF3298 domain-containing protein [Bacteroidaceae bacterium]
MNKYLKYITLLTVVGMSLTSCDFFKKGKTGEATEAADTLTICTVSYKDSLTLTVDSLEGEAYVEQAMLAAFPAPEATGPLADSIRAWLVQQIGQSMYPQWEEMESAERLGITYTVGEEQAFLDACASAGMKRMTESVQEAMQEGLVINYSNDYDATVSLNTDKLITYEVGYYVYSGGAHGGYLAHGQTFRCSDGRQMGWNMFDPAKRPQLIQFIKQQLCEYFSEDTEDHHTLSEEELMERLLLYDDPDTPENELEHGVPLPASAPYVTEKGMAFVYQQYEIAAYAYGLPSAIIPFETLKDCLTSEARELLDLK